MLDKTHTQMQVSLGKTHEMLLNLRIQIYTVANKLK